MSENFPNLKKETDIQVEERQKIPNRMNPNRPMSKHIIIKMAKLKIKREYLKKKSKGKAKSSIKELS